MNEKTVIVIADDDEGHANLIKKNLRRAGISDEILHFVDGEETIRFFSEARNDLQGLKKTSYLILLDIRMPKIDGIAVLEYLKKDSVLQKIPVIVITTTDDPREHKKCIDLGCIDYMVKPIEHERIIQTFEQLGFFSLCNKSPEISGY